jgi:hypothetical protein
MNPSLPVAVAMFAFALCAVQPFGAEADDIALPNHPPLLSPDEDQVFVGGLPPGESRVWKERVFLHGESITTALCAEGLLLQRIFPAAGPARGEGVLCLGDIEEVVEPHEYRVTTFIAGGLSGATRSFLEVPNCHLVAVDQSRSVTGDDSEPRTHIVTCQAEDGTVALLGQFLTSVFDEGGVLAAVAIPNFIEYKHKPVACETCDPVDCDPCCATCPD